MIAEALDRLSRDQADVATIFRNLQFFGVQIETISEGTINEMHVGLKGTMNALYLKNLADKTRRGLRGRVEAGKSGGGLCYGYKVVRAGGNPVVDTGEQQINDHEAAVVRRIFHDYASGVSPEAIAKRLNAEGVRGPVGMRGDQARSTGIGFAALDPEQRALHRARCLEPSSLSQESEDRQAHLQAQPEGRLDNRSSSSSTNRHR